MPKAEGEPWEQMDGAAADNECGVRGGFYPDSCGVCGSTVILHCDKCKVQVSGCNCILAVKVAEQREFNEKFSEIVNEDALRQRLEGEGLWLPPV